MVNFLILYLFCGLLYGLMIWVVSNPNRLPSPCALVFVSFCWPVSFFLLLTKNKEKKE